MAADCVTRVWALAIATAACLGLPTALVYAIVRVAAARRYGATFALVLVLVFWVTVSAAYYLRLCDDLLPWLRSLRCNRRRLGHGGPSWLVPQPSSFLTTDVFPQQQAPPTPAARGGARVRRADDILPPYPGPYEHQHVSLAQRYGDRGGGGSMMRPFHWEASTSRAWDWEASTSRDGGARAGTGDDDVPSWPHGDPSCSRMMAALPREPPAALSKARAAVAAAGVEQSDGKPSKYCPICMEDVDTEAAAKRLPLCLHLFHRRCIDQWLRDHSTCPICRCNAFRTDSCMSLDRR